VTEADFLKVAKSSIGDDYLEKRSEVPTTEQILERPVAQEAIPYSLGWAQFTRLRTIEF
jgi:hypothetical protein